jgi:hypothetical protein
MAGQRPLRLRQLAGILRRGAMTESAPLPAIAESACSS